MYIHLENAVTENQLRIVPACQVGDSKDHVDIGTTPDATQSSGFEQCTHFAGRRDIVMSHHVNVEATG
jgi:hypothetical protein